MQNRTRNFATVVYPESAPDNWKGILEEQCIPAFISPLNILVARNRKSGNLEIGVPVLGNRLFCAWLLVHFYGDISQGLAASAVRSSLY